MIIIIMMYHFIC